MAGRTVIVTGHTGFKGSWLSLWLASLGAKVVGISLPPDQGADNIFDRAAIADNCTSHIQDINDYKAIAALFATEQPEFVFHLAAQPLVLRGYHEPLLTFSTNIMGTAHILEAARQTSSVRSLVCITTDKVYDNQEWCWPYRENDALGGDDPYSASKSGAEMVAKSYMTAMMPERTDYHLATARGGNVIGGGDWAENRILPDIVRSIRDDQPLELRNPGSIRPWQHVLELCYGYLILASRLAEGWPDRNKQTQDFQQGWNFGPEATHEVPVSKLVELSLSSWGAPDYPVTSKSSPFHEANFLKLDCSKAKTELGWHPLLNLEETIDWTLKWYKDYLDNPDQANALCREQIAAYEARID